MTESELINFGVLNGWLKSIARVNDKTNNGHEFKIDKYPKSNLIHEFCSQTFSNVAEEIEIKLEKDYVSLLKEKFNFWFYNYQPNNPLKEYFLEDKSGNFSLYDYDWKREWVEEFIDLLNTTLKTDGSLYSNIKTVKRILL